MQQIEDELYGATVYTIMGHRLEFLGLCPGCSQNPEVRRKAEASIEASEVPPPF
jgi:Fur family ferric uptake transcriptional regulator